jgi:hypothetical protein
MATVTFEPLKISVKAESSDVPKCIKYKTILPFKVKYVSIGIPGVTGLVPPIGIAVVGVNNYIL